MGGDGVIKMSIDGSAVQQGIKSIEGAMKSLSNSVKSAASKVKSAFGRIGAIIKGGANTANRSFSSTMGSIKRLIPMILGVGSAYGIISKGVSAFMAQNQQLSSQMNSIWTAVGNLLGPVITKIIGWITTAVSYLLSFLNLLGLTGGKGAAALSKAANAAGGAAKEIQKTIAGFDELNVLQDNSGGGGGGGGAGLKDIEPTEWMKKLAELLKNKMWDEATDMIIEKMNHLIDVFKQKAFDWGVAIGEYVGGALHILARCIREFDWEGIGQGIARFFNGLMSQISGYDIGTILAAKLAVPLEIIKGFLEDINGEEMGTKVAEAVRGFFDTITEAIGKPEEWEKIGENIRGFLSAIWKKKGEIIESIRNFFVTAWHAAWSLFLGFLKGEGSAEDIPLVGALANLKKAIEEFMEAISPVLTKIKDEVLTPFITWLGETKLPEIINSVTEKITEITNSLNSQTESGEDYPIVATLKKLVEQVQAVIEAIGSFIEAAWPKLREVLKWTIETGLPKVLEQVTKFIQDITDLISGDKSFGEFITHMNGLEKALAALAIIKFGSGFLNFAANVKKIKDVFMGGGGAGGAGFIQAIKDFWAAISLGAEAVGGMAVIGPVAAVGVMALGAALSVAKTEAERWAIIEQTAGGTAEGWVGVCNELSDALSSNAVALQQAAAAGADTSELYIEQGRLLREYKQAVQETVEALGGEGEAVAEVAYKYAEQAAKVAELTEKKNQGIPVGNKLAEAEEELARIGEEYAEVLAAQGLALDKNGNIVSQVAQDVQEEAEAVKEGATATKDMTEKLDDVPDSAENAGKEMEGFGEDTKESAELSEQSISDLAQILITDWESIAEGVNAAAENMKTDVKTAMEDIKTTVTTIMPQIKTAFDSGWKGIHSSTNQQIAGIVRDCRSTFTNLAASCNTWGYDMMRQMAAGILRGAALVNSAVNRVASNVRSRLHFSEPDEGPLANFHTYMPDMMKLMAEGIESNADLPLSAVNNLADSMISKISNIAGNVAFSKPTVATGSVTPYSVGSTSAIGGSTGSASLDDVIASINGLRSFMNVNGDSDRDFHFNVYLDGKQLEASVTKRQQRTLRAKGVSA